MRGLPVLKNIPNFHHKRPNSKEIKQITSSTMRKSTLLMNCHQIIFNTQLLPLTIDLRNSPLSEFTIVIGFSSITGKYQSEQITLPWNFHSQKWVQISFGQSIGRIQIKTKQNQNKIDDPNIYTSVGAWQRAESTKVPKIAQHSIASLLKLLSKKSTIQANNTTRSKMKGNTMTVHLKNRTSQRANSYSLKPKMSSHRQKDSNITNWYDPRQETDELDTAFKPCSETLKLRSTKDQKTSKNDSLNGQIGAQMMGVRRLIDNKMKKFTPFFDELIPSKPKGRPKFYQQNIPLSFEEVEMKRGKFQSQFIAKKKTVSTHPFQSTETEESQVLEEIQRSEVQKSVLEFEDTFEQPKALGDCNLESGTLYESVFL